MYSVRKNLNNYMYYPNTTLLPYPATLPYTTIPSHYCTLLHVHVPYYPTTLALLPHHPTCTYPASILP